MNVFSFRSSKVHVYHFLMTFSIISKPRNFINKSFWTSLESLKIFFRVILDKFGVFGDECHFLNCLGDGLTNFGQVLGYFGQVSGHL